MQINLANTRLFRGMEPSDIEEMLGCLHAKEHAFQKGEIIFPEGVATEQIGVVLSGRVIIEMGDVWGNNSVLSSIGPGGVFAEAYACVPGEPLMVNVTAAEDTRALLLNIRRVLEPCANVCPRHVRPVSYTHLDVYKRQGDVRTKALRQVVTAVSDGAVAVHYAEEYLAENR